MPKRLPKRPVRALQRCQIEISDKDWTAIERGFGSSVPAAARQDIAEATNNFVAFMAAEHRALPIKDARGSITRIQKKAREFLSALNALHRDAGDLLERHSADNGRVSGNVAAFAASCDYALAELQNMTAHYEGGAWAAWVRDLTSIAKAHGLPSAARKDIDKSDRVSPFVRLVKALQDHIPKNYRRHAHSDWALAKAVSIARRDV